MALPRAIFATLALPGSDPTFDCTSGPGTKNALAPSSDRPERRVDTWYHRGMSIFHHTIDSRGPGGDPRPGTGRELPGTVREPVFDRSVTIPSHFQKADHMS